MEFMGFMLPRKFVVLIVTVMLVVVAGFAFMKEKPGIESGQPDSSLEAVQSKANQVNDPPEVASAKASKIEASKSEVQAAHTRSMVCENEKSILIQTELASDKFKATVGELTKRIVEKDRASGNDPDHEKVKAEVERQLIEKIESRFECKGEK